MAGLGFCGRKGERPMKVATAVCVFLGAIVAFVGSASAQDGAASSFMPTTFEVVHLETTGQTVVVGTAEPGATIELLEGTTVIARAEANDLGEWAIAPDGLAAGTHTLAIRTTSADGRFQVLSRQTIAIDVTEPAAASAGESTSAPGPAFTIADFAITIDVSAGAGTVIEGAIGYPQLVVVARGDSPWKLAQRFYGDGTLYQLIIDANQEAIRRAGTLLPGMTLIIPDPAGR
jgi:nucleoid-associated protein YgaU